jgi:acyl-coenzyme A thioesterase PaaI-like protein
MAFAGALAMSASTLSLYRRITRWPAGHWIFSRAICVKAPYFATIAPRFIALEPGHCEIRIRDRRRVHNHLGTVHAIALCNLAELSAGMLAEVTVPSGMRWIPKGMTVEYLKLAVGTMRAVATPDAALLAADDGQAWPVTVLITDPAGQLVFRASVMMWVSPRKRA